MSSLTNFRTEVAAILGLDNSVSGDQPLMDVWINEGVADVLIRTHCKQIPFEMALTANEGDYTLSTDILAIVDLFVSSGGDQFSPIRSTPSQILDLRRNASVSTPVLHYATAGANLLMVYPIPDSADTLTGLYVPRPTTLASGSDTPSEIPAEWHKLVTFYALWRGADYDDDTTSEQGERYRGLYERGIQECRAAIFKHGGFRMAPSVVNPRKRRRLPHSNSADY